MRFWGFLQGWVAISLLGTSVAVAAPTGEPPERVVWDRTPIPVVLPVGEERLVHFPAPMVRVGVPDLLPLRTMSVDGTVYWRAGEAFEPVRVVVESLGEGGGFFLLDIEAREGAPAVPLAILRSGAAANPGMTETVEPSDTIRHQNLDYVALTRFAAQQLYAPSRLRPEHPALRPIPIGRLLSTDADSSEAGSRSLVRGGDVSALPLLAWRHGGLYLTAVRLRNETASARVLDPRDLRGDWLAATFQHARLLPQGDGADTTAVYLISRRPFDESLFGVR